MHRKKPEKVFAPTACFCYLSAELPRGAQPSSHQGFQASSKLNQEGSQPPSLYRLLQPLCSCSSGSCSSAPSCFPGILLSQGLCTYRALDCPVLGWRTQCSIKHQVLTSKRNKKNASGDISSPWARDLQKRWFSWVITGWGTRSR